MAGQRFLERLDRRLVLALLVERDAELADGEVLDERHAVGARAAIFLLTLRAGRLEVLDGRLPRPGFRVLQSPLVEVPPGPAEYPGRRDGRLMLLREVEMFRRLRGGALTNRLLQLGDGLVVPAQVVERDALVPVREVAVAHAVEARALVLLGIGAEGSVEGLHGLRPPLAVHVLEALDVGVVPRLRQSRGRGPGDLRDDGERHQGSSRPPRATEHDDYPSRSDGRSRPTCITRPGSRRTSRRRSSRRSRPRRRCTRSPAAPPGHCMWPGT